jgi:hypothetical protein
MNDDIEIEKNRVYLIYDAAKTALLNKYYYGRRLMEFRRYNFWSEIIIAMGAAGSGGAGLAVWKTNNGQMVWAIISGLSVIFATVKPALRLAERVENYAKLYAEYTGTFVKMNIHVQDIQFERKVTVERFKAFGDLRIQAAELENLGDPVRNKKLVRELEETVNREIPIGELWVPRVPEPSSM